MTALAAPSIAVPRSRTTVAIARRAIPGILVAFAVAYTTTLFAEATGGRGAWALTKAAAVVLVALIAVRPWRHLRAGVLGLAAGVSIAALVVCLVTPPGWFGSNRAASYGLAAATFISVASYARRVTRARALAATVAAAGAVQFFWAFIPWWGGRDASVPMTGTFYWHNQFAAFLLAPALVGLSLCIEHRAPWRLVGWIVVPFAVAGVVHSSSRGALLVLGGGWLLMGAMAARANRKAIGRWCGASLLAAAVTMVVSGPPFFSAMQTPFAATQARAATGETAEANGQFRIYMWREAISVFEHDPVTGVGYGALAPAAAKVTPAAWPRSPLVHNDYLQSLADGGLLLGLPFLAACAAIGLLLARGLRGRVGTRVVDVRLGLTVGALALLAHSAIDFNWSYPALFTLTAVVTALATAPLLGRPPTMAEFVDAIDVPVTRRGGVSLRIALVGLLAAVVSLGAIAARDGGNRLAYHAGAPAAGTPAAGTASP